MQITIEPQPLSGAENMQRDADMLEAALADGTRSLRLYMWETATVSLGYFQKEHDVPERFANLPQVKRLSGGGAILHEHELTYSIALPPDHGFSNASLLYDVAHNAFVEELERAGISTCLRRDFDQPADDAPEPFLCFARHSEFDVVFRNSGPGWDAGTKVLGSAQRRRKGAVLQHGSLILRKSEFTPEFPGVLEAAEFEIRAFSENLVKRISAEFASTK